MRTSDPLGDRFWQIERQEKGFISFPALKRLIAQAQADLVGGTAEEWKPAVHEAIEALLRESDAPDHISVVELLDHMDWQRMARELPVLQVLNE